MSKTRTGNRGYCTACSKYIHKTAAAAYAHRKQLIGNGRHRFKTGALSVYRCPHGLGWHIGHATRSNSYEPL